MSYYTRVFSRASTVPSFDALSALIGAAGFTAHRDGRQLAALDSNGALVFELDLSVRGGNGLLEDEITEFDDALDELEPRSGANWAREFLAGTTWVVGFLHGEAGFGDDAFALVEAVRERLFALGPAIIQADGEGFTNTDRPQIVWDFDDGATGDWTCAVRVDGAWVGFVMDLGNEAHRAAFKAGRVPEGARPYPPVTE